MEFLHKVMNLSATAPLPNLTTTESTPWAERTVTIERELNVYNGKVRTVKRTAGSWQLKSTVKA